MATAAAGLAAAVAALLLTAAPAAASSNLIAMFEEPSIEQPAATPSDIATHLQILRSLGVRMLRVNLAWNLVAPNPSSRARPGFNATDPSQYNWGFYDRLISQAQAYGMGINLLVNGGAPLWATQPSPPPPAFVGGTTFSFDSVNQPSASEYGQFVQAVARRYPSVHFWELWDEANWGPALAPQYVGSALVSARVYRGLVDAGWNALQRTGHGGDIISLGSFSQDGSSFVGQTGTSAPLVLLRAAYCVDSNYRLLRGAAARQVGCPNLKTAKSKIRNKTLRQQYLKAQNQRLRQQYVRAFKRAHPGLFNASGWGVHPYPYGKPPTQIDFPTPDGLEFAEIPHLYAAVDRVQRVFNPVTCTTVVRHHHKKKRCHTPSIRHQSAFNTEYGYQNNYVSSLDVAAYYLNWAEYLSWKDPRMGSIDQYELQDSGWFQTGLLNLSGQPKPSFYAYRLPVFLPVTSTTHGHSLEVWGEARPAHYARIDTGQTQFVSIQWSSSANGPYSTVSTVPVDSNGYFDVNVAFPGSGFVRLAYTYPSGDSSLANPLDPSQTVYSRVTGISS